MQLTDHFSTDELECKCCGECHMDREFIAKLEAARVYADVPFSINSGYRCNKHNFCAGGKKTSAHMKGMAADIACEDDHTRYVIIMALVKAGFTRMGIGVKFIHVDNDFTKNAERVWVY